MADIFVAYASADRDRVAVLARELTVHGWSVWWDRKIPPGKTFDEVIEEALDESRAVLAVWTEAAAASRWVRTEAAEGAARSVLVPVLMDDVKVPLAFRRIQAADLRDWEPGTDHAGFDELIDALTEIIGPEEPEETDPLALAINAAQGQAAEADWTGVITVLSPFEAEDSDFAADQPEAAELLALAQRKQQALALYEEAEVLYTNARWGDVVTRFDQILELDPDFEYGTDLKTRAKQHIEQEKELRLAALYDRAAAALEAREWPLAVALFEQLNADAPDYRDVAMQLELARSGAETDRRYRDLQQKLREGHLDPVISGIAELAAANPEFGDPDDLLGQATALAHSAQPPPVEPAEPTAVVETGTATAAGPEAPQPDPEQALAPESGAEPEAGPRSEPAPETSAVSGSKWRWIIAGIAAVGLVAVIAIVAIAGGDDVTSTTAADSAAPDSTTASPEISTAREATAAAPASDQLVCLVADVAGVGDRGYNAAAWEGAGRAAAEFGAEARLLESGSADDYEPNIRAFVEQGCDVIVTVGWQMGEVTLALAEANPETAFAIVDIGYEAPPPNLRGLVFATEEPSFMAGYAAASMTNTGRVGVFGGMEIPTVTIFMDAYLRGVDFYNTQKAELGDLVSGSQPRVEVLGWNPETREGLFTGNFESPDDGRAFAQELANQGADIIMPIAGIAGYGASALASELGTFMVVGVDVDMTLTDPENAQVYLTSVTKGVQNAVQDAAAEALAGHHTNEPYLGTLANGGVGLAPNQLDRIVPDELKIELETLRQLIIEGVINPTE